MAGLKTDARDIARLLFASPRSRTRRTHEWTRAKAVTFIVTLAKVRSVTLAARASGMSRKSAYALKARDIAFASAWAEALGARKVEEVEGTPAFAQSG